MSLIRENVWKLRTDPFYPVIDSGGNPIAPESLERSLNPLVDARVVPFYFDVYDWSASALVRDLSTRHALDIFPTPRSLPGTGLLVLISGSRETGVNSLANLMLHRIRLAEGGRTLLVVDVRLESRDTVRNVETVVNRLINRVKFGKPAIADAKDIARDMEYEYDRARKEQEGRKDASYTELFQTFRDMLDGVERTPVIELISGGDHDSWARIHESTRSCCPYMIVMTPDFPYAKTCYDAMTGSSGNVAWIQAKPLDRARAWQYVEHRLAAERLAPAAPGVDQAIFPFTRDAIAALYEPGTAGASGKPLQHPVGFLRRTLYTAFADHLDAMDQQHAGASAAVMIALDPATTVVGRPQVIAARNKLNRGA